MLDEPQCEEPQLPLEPSFEMVGENGLSLSLPLLQKVVVHSFSHEDLRWSSEFSHPFFEGETHSSPEQEKNRSSIDMTLHIHHSWWEIGAEVLIFSEVEFCPSFSEVRQNLRLVKNDSSPSWGPSS